ncbi:MAG: type II toxin-antitoxin system PemK/MazF family toxin [Nanoarchaeota archaeon]
MEVSQKEIVLMPCPYSDFNDCKIRPAIIVSNNHINKSIADCIVVPLTSAIRDAPYSIIIGSDDLDDGDLEQVSMAKINRIFSIKKDKILKRIGSVNDSIFDKIREEIRKAI